MAEDGEEQIWGGKGGWSEWIYVWSECMVRL